MFTLIKKLLLGLSLALLSSTFSVNANNSLMLSFGSGLSDDLVQSYNINSAKQFSLGAAWHIDTKLQKQLIGYDKFELETYLSRITKQQTMNIAAIRPILTFQVDENSSWYWQIGVGLSYFDNRTLEPAQLSTDLQFASILGVGIHLDSEKRNRLTLRYNHYSNAYIKRPNPGIDTLSLDWHWQFSD
jgi:hypothetical protein